jgi:murein DD-endopeptidase MepM/ murein hydrolase activator NlpD
LIFSKKKYRFDPITLSYEEIRPARKRSVIKYLLYAIGFVVYTAFSGYILNAVFGSPKMHMLEADLLSLNNKMEVLMIKGNEYSSSLESKFKTDNSYRTILQIDTLNYNIRQAGTGGKVQKNRHEREMDIRLKNLISHLNEQLKIQSASYDIISEKAREYNQVYKHMPAIQPVAQKDLIMISSNFGVRTDPFVYMEQVHYGLDFVAATGKNVYATGDGIVTFTRFSRTGYGNEIIIDHAFGFGSRYAHLSKILVTEGQKVKRGHLIGKVGSSGRATGPHLHYEVLHENSPVNPAYYFDNSLTEEEYQQILTAANETN